MSWDTKAHDLLVGYKALSGGLTAPQTLSRTFLRCCNGEPFAQVLASEAKLSPPQALELSQSVPPPPPPVDPKPTPVTTKTVIQGTRCDLRIEGGEHWTRYVGKRKDDPQPVSLHHFTHAALRHGLWLDFLEAVRATQGLECLNLVPVLDVGRDADGFAVVSRFFPGAMTLRRLLDRVVRLKLSEALRITREVAQGLVALHAKGVVHRALTPESVVLTREGRVLIRDTGVVWETPGSKKSAAHYGDMHYMGPECFKGVPPNPLSDVYALGIMCYEMATGTRPFEGDAFDQLKHQHAQIPPIKPHEILQDLPDTLSDLLVWLLSKQPSDRPDAPKLVNVLKTLERNIDRTGRTERFQAFGRQ